MYCEINVKGEIMKRVIMDLGDYLKVEQIDEVRDFFKKLGVRVSFRIIEDID